MQTPLPKLIDNRTDQSKLVAVLPRLLADACSADFASGYFFLSGFEQIAGHLDGLQKLRLLIGTQSNRQTVEQIAEGYARREIAADEIRRNSFLTPAQKQERADAAKNELAQELENVPQSDAGEKMIEDLRAMIADNRLEIRVYTKARLHAKAYIFDHKHPTATNAGVSIVGSSNFTLSGVKDNTELNVFVHDNNGEHAAMKAWFGSLWDEAEPFDAALMDELEQSWASKIPTPWQIYIKALLALVGDRLDGTRPDIGSDSRIEAMLTDFQRDAVTLAERTLEKWGGCFVSDVVGLGKSFIGAAIVKRAEMLHRARPLIICPKPLEAMWERYNEEFELNAKVVAMSVLKEDGGADLSEYANRNFVLIDESHNFRNDKTQRYRALDDFLADGDKRVCLLTATPLNSRSWDIYHQLKLFHREDLTQLAIDPPELKKFFKKVEQGEAKLTSLLPQILIRRRRQDVLRLYGYARDSDIALKTLDESAVAPYLRFEKAAYVFVGGKKQGFPKRNLKTWRYSIESTYNGLYEEIRRILGEPGDKRKKGALNYARYGLWNYLPKSLQKSPNYSDLTRAGVNLRGLIRTMLFKRFESSVCAFTKTLERMIASQKLFLRALDEGRLATGADAQAILRLAASGDEDELMERLEESSNSYDPKDFSVGDLRGDILSDIGLLEKIYDLVKPIEAENDDKLQTFLGHMNGDLKGKKVVVFTQYLDTARYIYENGVEAADVAMVSSGNGDKSELVARFAPRANRVVREKQKNLSELRVLVATDVLSEGLNLQDGDIIVNYDLHWNPVRLIQRFGRIDRIGSEHEQIYGFNFLPETKLDSSLGIEAVLKRRIAEIHNTLGEDAAILHPEEALNEEAMRAIYTGEEDGERHIGNLFEDVSERDELAFLNEAEVLLRRLRDEEPQEWKAIADLRGGVRSARVGIGNAGKKIVVCRAGDWIQLYLCDETGVILSRDASTILPILECAREIAAPGKIPAGHNLAVSRVREQFESEFKMRRAALAQAKIATPAQKWISERLLEWFALNEDDAKLREQIPIVERALRADGLPQSVRTELARLHKSKAAGEDLWRKVVKIYSFHDLQNRPEKPIGTDNQWPTIVCSLALL